MTRPVFLRWSRLTRLPLALEITLALLIKVVILYALWHAFFSHPQARHMLLPTSQVEQHLLTGSAAHPPPDSSASAADSVPPSQPKAHHGSH